MDGSTSSDMALPQYAMIEGDFLSLSSAISGLVDVLGAVGLAVEQLNNQSKPKHVSSLGRALTMESKTLRATLRLLQRCLNDRHQKPQRAAMIQLESLVVVLLDLVLLCDDLRPLAQKMEAESGVMSETRVQLFERHGLQLRPATKRFRFCTLILTAMTNIFLG
jgi:hypothetical protein